MSRFSGKTAFITGASRGIGLEIAKALGREGCNVAIAAKSAVPHPKLRGTIYSAAEEVESLGGRALALRCDIRDEDAVGSAIDKTVSEFGGIDILINNASAIWLKGIAETPLKRFDLMHEVNSRGSFLCTQFALPHLLQSKAAHVLTLAPPPNLNPKWWGAHTAYTMAKMGMSFFTLGLAAELSGKNIGVAALWPKTVIATDALKMIPGVDLNACRYPNIVADAALDLLCRAPQQVHGKFFIDEEVLRESGVSDFDVYAVQPGRALLPDLFLDNP